MQLTLLSLIYFIACSHALMLGIALWRNSDKGQSGKVLALLLFTLAYKMFEGAVSYSSLYQTLPHTLGWLPGAVLIIGPVFWAYVKSATGEQSLTTKQWLIHLLPALLLISINTPQLFIAASEKIANIERYNAFEGTPILPTRVIIFLIILKCHLASYLSDSWQTLSRFNQHADHLRADNSPFVLSRLKQLCLALIALEALWVTLFLLQQSTGFVALEYVSKAWLLFIAVIVLSMGYYGLKNPNLYFTSTERMLINQRTQPYVEVAQKSQSSQVIDTEVLDNNANNVVYIETTETENKAESKTTAEKYSQSSLSDAVAQQVCEIIETSFKRDKLYLDDKLTLSSMAEQLELKPHLVSQVINQYMSSSFYKLVNKYRVLHAANLLEQSTNNWSLERIAYESGFGNRVTFNSAFKEIKGCTASAYRKNIKSVSQLVS